MIVVRETFICKPGQASKMAKMFKDMMADWEGSAQVLTDVMSEFNQVIMESRFESLTDYEKKMEMYMKDEKQMEKMKAISTDYHDMFLTGKREVFKVW